MKNGKYILTTEAIKLAKEKGFIYPQRQLNRVLKNNIIKNYFEGYRYFIEKESFLKHLDSLGNKYREKTKNGRR